MASAAAPSYSYIVRTWSMFHILYVHACTPEHEGFMREICIFSCMHALHAYETCMKHAWNLGTNPCMQQAWKVSQIPACYMHVSGIMHVTWMKFRIIQYCHWNFMHGTFWIWGHEMCWNMHVWGAPFWVGCLRLSGRKECTPTLFPAS